MTIESTDHNPASRLRLEAQLRGQASTGAIEDRDPFREDIEASFARAIATLTPEQAAKVSDLTSCRDMSAWELRGSDGQLIAKVSFAEPRNPAPAAVRRVATPAKVARTDSKLALACAKKILNLQEVFDVSMKRAFERINALETQSAIDAELVKELENIAVRVDAIETRGFRFLGKYQAPATYKAGDVVAYKDALWHCVQDCKVGERPNTASHKWTLMMSACEE